MQKKELQSEKEPEPEPGQDQFTPSAQSEGTNLVFLKKVNFTGKNYTDQTGRFKSTYSQGNKYILVAYHYYSNTIHTEPFKTRTGLHLKTDNHKLYSLLTKRGLKPSLHILDNECPNVLKTFMMEVNE